MLLNNLKIKTKIYAIVLVSMFFIVFIAFTAMITDSDLNDSVVQVQKVSSLEKLLLQKEIDHYKWSAIVKDAIVTEGVTSIDVEKNDHNCGLGKWLYGSDREKLVKQIPEIDVSLKEMEVSHHKLHQSAIELEKMLRDESLGISDLLDFYNHNTEIQLNHVHKHIKDIRDDIVKTFQSVDEEMNKNMTSAKSTNFKYVVLILFALITLSVLGFILAKNIVSALNEGVSLAQKIEQGDLLAIIETTRSDEIGDLLYALNNMAKNLQKIFREIFEYSDNLNNTATAMTSVSKQLADSSNNVNEKTNSVSTAAEEMSMTMASVSNVSEQASANIRNVSASTEEMTATISEIAKSAETARSITAKAVNSVSNAADKVKVLGEAAIQINQVIEAINDISEQTKLLALNATIEAARAGEAGKGFAVVANEVKELAKQTNDAIDDIRSKIEAIQTSTKDTIAEISEVNKVVSEVHEIVSIIATAVEEQSAATQDIANNVNQAATGINEMSNSVTESATVSQSIAQDIGLVNNSSNQVLSDSKLVNQNADDVSNISILLEKIVKQFKLN